LPNTAAGKRPIPVIGFRLLQREGRSTCLTNPHAMKPGRIVAALLALNLAACTGDGGDMGKTIAIGSDFATSGADASAGIPTQNAALLAVEQAARQPLPGGYRLTLKTLDDTVAGVHDPGQGARNLQSFVHDSAVVAVVGPTHSNVARAEIPIANAAKLALMSPSATSINLTEDASGATQLRPVNPRLHNFFRTVLRDDLQGAADADFARSVLHARRVYVVDDNEAYGKGLADVFVRAFARYGGHIIERAHLTKGQQDFIALLTRIASLEPDLIYYGGVVSTGGAQLRRQMVKLQIPAKYMGGDGLKEEGFLYAAGPAADGVYCSDGAPNLDLLPSARAFVKAYSERFPHQPIGTYSANAYAAVQVEIAAVRSLMQRNGGVPPARADVVRAIERSKTPGTPLGDVSFTSQGDITTPVVSMWLVRGGRFTFLSQQRERLTANL
jgi:branched-chain amino acid transport system substrate-binding protein